MNYVPFYLTFSPIVIKYKQIKKSCPGIKKTGTFIIFVQEIFSFGKLFSFRKVKLMFQFNYGGYNICSKDSFVIYRPNGSKDYLLLLFLASMKVHFADGGSIVTRPNACILYPPEVFQHYHAVSKFYNSYMHFSTDEDFLNKFPVPVNQVFYLENHQELNLMFKETAKEFYMQDLYREYKLDILIKNLLIELSRSVHHKGLQNLVGDKGLREVFDQARLTILQSCHKDWSTEEMCRLVNLGKSQFFYYYNLFYNCTPRADLLEARLDKAKDMLTSEATQVCAVAEACGFHNICYFTRYFTKKCGCAPSRFCKSKKESAKQTLH